MLQYNVSFEIAGIAMLLVILAFLQVQYTVPTRSSKAFSRLVLLVLITEVFDVAAALFCVRGDDQTLVPAAILSSTVYFAASFIMEYLLVGYIHTHCEETRLAKVTRIIDIVVLVAALLVAVTTPFSGALFSFEGGVYTYGPMHFITYALPVYYMLVAMVLVYVHKECFTYKERFSYIGFVVATMLGVVLQSTTFSDILLTVFGASIGTLVLLFGLETADYPALMKTMGELEDLKDNLQEKVLEQTALAIARQEKVERLSLETVQALAHAIDAKDEYTNGHSTRVAGYTVLLARELGWDEKRVEDLGNAALLHDIGKIGVPDSILNKPDRLSNVEYQIIQSHTVLGADILKGISNIPDASAVARSHHERWDGRGYPEGLAGLDIPETARVVAVADSYDAMTSRRVYRRALPMERVRSELEKGIGTQFDPDMAKAFLKMFDEGRLVLEDEDVPGGLKDASSVIHENFDRAKKDAEESMRRDYLTGLRSRFEGEENVRECMEHGDGWVALIDVDNLRQLNDIGGYDLGDKAIQLAASIIEKAFGEGVVCRFGGDEFLCFIAGLSQEEIVALMRRIYADFEHAKDPLMQDVSMSTGLYYSTTASELEKAVANADKALYFVKQSGKGGFYIYGQDDKKEIPSTDESLARFIREIEEGKYAEDTDVQYRNFVEQLEFASKGVGPYSNGYSVLMVTLCELEGKSLYIEEIDRAMASMDQAIRETVRTSDVCTRFGGVQHLVILAGAGKEEAEIVADRILRTFFRIFNSNEMQPTLSIIEVPGKTG